jgi:HSP20 family protein
MPIARWRRPESLPVVVDEMDRLFDRYFRSPLLRAVEGEAFEFGPAVDVYETETEFVVKAELPGAKREDIELTLEDDKLALRGEIRHEDETDEGGYHRKEIRRGTFHRSIAIPSSVIQDQFTATFENGVLTVRAAKSEQAASGKRIAVQ